MNNNEACAHYFRQQSEYDRCFRELRKKWCSLGRVSGMIVLKEATDGERRKIGGLLGRAFYETEIKFSFSQFEQALQRTRFAPVDMRGLLEAYFDEMLVTNQAKKQGIREDKEAFWEMVCSKAERQWGRKSAAYQWISELMSAKKWGYQIVMREYGKGPADAETLVMRVAEALTYADMTELMTSAYRARSLASTKKQEKELPLAVLAASVSGNPHYFDRGTVSGQLLVHAICCVWQLEIPLNAGQWRDLLQLAGILADPISSIVHAHGVRLLTSGGYHPAYEAFLKEGDPFVVTLENLKKIVQAEAVGEKVFVVENEMVFGYLVERLHDVETINNSENCNCLETVDCRRPSGCPVRTILCTSGQIHSAGLKLIELLLASGAEIHYSGDMDPEGMNIADRLWRQFGEHIHMWRMAQEDYEAAISGETIPQIRLAKLDRLEHPELIRTAKVIKREKLAAYQENLVEKLVEDIVKS